MQQPKEINVPAYPAGFLRLVLALRLGKSPTNCLQATGKKKTCYFFSSRLSFINMGWLMGLEPTTTGITILDSTN